MSGTSAQLSRLLALLPWLLARPGTRIADVAAEFGISEARLRKELDLLWVCGLPGHGPGDLIDFSFEGDTVTVIETAGVERPLRLTVDEALALVVALRALAETPGLRDRDAVDRALAKVEQAAGESAAPAERVEVALEGEERVLPVVQAALDAGRQLHLSYYVPSRDETTDRDVDPMRVLVVEGRTYLEAWCRRTEGVRLFRLDRVEDVALLDTPAQPPPEARPRDVSQGLFVPSPDTTLVTLALRPAAAWVAEYHPCESVQESSDGGLTVRLRVADLAWARRLVLRLGPHVRVLGPPELASDVRAEAALALSAYGDEGRSG
ncbi:MAG: helix-turn-helix transcriptional regulator [Actinomycetes bacterium]